MMIFIAIIAAGWILNKILISAINSVDLTGEGRREREAAAKANSEEAAAWRATMAKYTNDEDQMAKENS